MPAALRAAPSICWWVVDAGMDDQGLGVSDIGKVGKELQSLDELRAGFAAPLEFETEDCAWPLRQEAFRELVVGMGREFGPQDAADGIVVGKEGDDGTGVLDMARHAQWKGLHALEQVRRRWPGSCRRQSRAVPPARARMMKAPGPNSSAKSRP